MERWYNFSLSFKFLYQQFTVTDTKESLVQFGLGSGFSPDSKQKVISGSDLKCFGSATLMVPIGNNDPPMSRTTKKM